MKASRKESVFYREVCLLNSSRSYILLGASFLKEIKCEHSICLFDMLILLLIMYKFMQVARKPHAYPVLIYKLTLLCLLYLLRICTFFFVPVQDICNTIGWLNRWDIFPRNSHRSGV